MVDKRLSKIYFAALSCYLQIYANMLSIFYRSVRKIRFYEGELFGYKTNSQMSPFP